MARKTSKVTGKATFTAEGLALLGAEKLARIILTEAEINAGFRKLVKAALAGADGADAVARLVDRRLAGLEKARAMVDWRKERAFADDLATSVRQIAGELADQDVRAAAERLIRFIATHATVFERIDDSSGRIQSVFADAVEECGRLFARLAEDERSWLTINGEAYACRVERIIRIGPISIQIARPRGQRLTGDSEIDLGLLFGGSLGRADWSDGRRMGADRAVAARRARARLPAGPR